MPRDACHTRARKETGVAPRGTTAFCISEREERSALVAEGEGGIPQREDGEQGSFTLGLRTWVTLSSETTPEGYGCFVGNCMMRSYLRVFVESRCYAFLGS